MGSWIIVTERPHDSFCRTPFPQIRNLEWTHLLFPLHFLPQVMPPSCPSELALWRNPDLAAKPFTLPSPSALSIDFSFVYVHPSLSKTSLPVILHISVDLSHIGMGSWGTGETNQRSNVMEAPLTLTVPILRAVTHSWVAAHLQCLCDGCLPLLRLSSCSLMALCRY